jgi:hypothetical protein
LQKWKFLRNDISRNVAKITSFSHDFRFSRKWKKPFSFQPYLISLQILQPLRSHPS